MGTLTPQKVLMGTLTPQKVLIRTLTPQKVLIGTLTPQKVLIGTLTPQVSFIQPCTCLLWSLLRQNRLNWCMSSVGGVKTLIVRK